MEQTQYSIKSIAEEAAALEYPVDARDSEMKREVTRSLEKNTATRYLAKLAQHLLDGDIKATTLDFLGGHPFVPGKPDMDHTDAYWVLSELERERALQLLGVPKRAEPAGADEASAKLQRQIERGYFLDEVAESLALQQGKPSGWAKRLLASLEEAGALPRADPLSLRLRDPHTGIIDPRGTKRSGSLVATVPDVNAWLQAQGMQFQWRDPNQSEPQRAQPVTPEPPKPPEATQEPAGGDAPGNRPPADVPDGPTLTRDEVATAFANEKAGVGRQWWIDQMDGQKSKWLMECRAKTGTTGGDRVTQSRWFPVLIAQRLAQGRPAKYKPGIKEMDRVFRRPEMQPWAAAWRVLKEDTPGWDGEGD